MLSFSESVKATACIVLRIFLTILHIFTVDNTNADPETRAHWINLAKDLKVPIRCIYLTTTGDICKHNNAVRAANSKLVSSPLLLFGILSE